MRNVLIVGVLLLGACAQSVDVAPPVDAGVRTWECSAYPIPNTPPLRYDGRSLVLNVDGCEVHVDDIPSDGLFAFEAAWRGACEGMAARTFTIERGEAVPSDGTFWIQDLDVRTATHEWYFPVITCHETTSSYAARDR